MSPVRSVPSQNPTQCWCIVKFVHSGFRTNQWKLNHKTITVIKRNVSGNVVNKITIILFRPHCLNWCTKCKKRRIGRELIGSEASPDSDCVRTDKPRYPNEPTSGLDPVGVHITLSRCYVSCTTHIVPYAGPVISVDYCKTHSCVRSARHSVRVKWCKMSHTISSNRPGSHAHGDAWLFRAWIFTFPRLSLGGVSWLFWMASCGRETVY